MDKPIHLEVLAANVMIPVMIWEDYWDGTHNTNRLAGISRREYKNKLDEFTFAEKRDYRGFRKFLAKHSIIFKDKYDLLRNLTDGEVDYIFAKVGEERIKSSVFH